MTYAPPTIRGADSAALSQPASIGKLGDKRFTAQAETGQGPSALATAQSRSSVLGGVKRLLRAAMHSPLPRAVSPLRKAQRELDATHERLLKTLLNGKPLRVSRSDFIFTLRQTVEAEAAFVVAGGRIAALHPDDPALLYLPSLDAFTFTELLLLRERLPRLAESVSDMAPLDARAQAILNQSLRAVDNEITARDQPFKAVLRVLAQPTPTLEDLDGALYALACAVSARERHGESPGRFLGDLAASKGNVDLENAAASLASAPIRVAYATTTRHNSRERLAISAHDGGVGACARILKNALDECLRSRLVVRAGLDFKQGADNGRAPIEVVGSVLDMLVHGVTAMNGDIAPVRSQRDAQVMALFARALADYDGADLHGYLTTLSDAALGAMAGNLSVLPTARRKTMQQAIDNARRAQARDRAAGSSSKRPARPRLSQTLENVSVRATPLLARAFARVKAEISKPENGAFWHPQQYLYAAQPGEALTHMSFDVTARTDGTYEVSVRADLTPDTGNDTASHVYKNRIAPDLSLLRGEFRPGRSKNPT